MGVVSFGGNYKNSYSQCLQYHCSSQDIFGEILSESFDANYSGNKKNGGNTTLPTLLSEFNYSDLNKPGFLL